MCVRNLPLFFTKTLLLFINQNKAPFFKQIHHPYSTRKLTKIGVFLPRLENNALKSKSFYLTHITLIRNLPIEIKPY